MKSIFLLLIALFTLASCSSDDDICTSGEATPRIKIKFRNKSTGTLKTLDSVYVNVNYGAGDVAVVERKVKTDSLLIPLRVDDVPFTDIFVGLSKTGTKSKVRINYTTQTKYVSPACGIKKLYENLNPTLETSNPVNGLELNQSAITDENKTHLYLLF